MASIAIEIHSKNNKLLGEYEIDIEPNAEDEPEHLYVVITKKSGEVYEGRLPIHNLWPED